MPAVRVGLVGLGRWGVRYLRTLAPLTDVQLIAVCDQALERRLEAAGEVTAPLKTRRFDDLLASDVDAIIVATPTATHGELASRALSAGKHVLVEKPLGRSIESAEAVVAAAFRARKVVSVGHLLLHHPSLSYLARNRASLIGRIRTIQATRISRGAAHSDENALSALFSHDAATLLGCLGLTALRIRANATDPSHQVVRIDIEFAEGVSAQVLASRLGGDVGQKPTRQLRIRGTEGACVFDESTGEVRHAAHAAQGSSQQVMAKRWDGESELSGTVVQHASPENLLELSCAHFFHRIAVGDVGLSEARLGVSVVRLIAAAYRSLDGGGAWAEVSLAQDAFVVPAL